MSTRKITVVIPAYNHEKYIAAAISSVLEQRVDNLELHVLDDGSSDDTLMVAERALNNPGDVGVRLERQDNLGASQTLNRLIERSDTDYVAILNSDDLYAPGRLSQFAKQVRDDELFFGFSGIEFIENSMSGEQQQFHHWYQSKLGVAMRLPTCGFAQLASNLAVTSSNFFFSRQLFDVVGGFDPQLQFSQDWDFSVKAMRWTEPRFFPQRLMKYRIHPKNSWRQLHDVRHDQLQQVLGNYASWALEHCPNSIAPVPGQWPRLFPIFARSCGSWFNDAPIGESLPRSVLEATPDPTYATPADAAALVRLLQTTELPGRDFSDTDSTLLRASGHWGKT